jgi:hypothetical protein
MNQILIRQSRRKNLLYVLGGICVALFGYWLVEGNNPEPTEGVLMLVVGAVMAIFSVLRLRDSSPAIIIDGEGIELPALGIERMPWSEISFARTERPRNVTYLHIEMTDPEGVVERYPAVERMLSEGEIVMAADGYELDADDIADAIMRSRSGLDLTPDQLSSISSR